jgi:hypothetical protein
VTLGVLALLGSGEIAPSMTKVHRQLLNRLTDVRAVSLDTPYGFQANVPQMTEKIIDYFATSLQVAIKPLRYESFERSSEVQRAIFRQEVREANYVFAGPGSPSYAVRQWEQIGVADDLNATLREGGILCFASAAALTLGALTVPVYEIYKVGSAPHWINGLDILAMTGLRGAIIPHYDNAEGGNYDTRYCYLGEQRLIELEGQLPEGTGILGIDEHTAAIIDLEDQTLSVLGKGHVYWRLGGDTRVLANGSVTDLEEIRSFQPVDAVPVITPPPDADDVDRLVALARSDGAAAVEAIARLARMATAGGKDFIDPAPLVTSLLDMRERARADRDFALADQIRDVLVRSGIEVMDGPTGSTWSVR